MKFRLLLLFSVAASLATAAEPLLERIHRLDPDNYRDLKAVHAGAGTMQFGELLPGESIHELRFVHRGVVHAKSGIGHHMHNSTEEMFVVFGGNVQFTIDGHTAEFTGPVGVPVRLGQAHALYNAGNTPVQWMNISVRRSDMPALGRGEDPTGSVDLGDDRVGGALSRVPEFLTAPFDRAKLQPVANLHGGKGTVSYARKIGPSFFRTNWAYVDHLLVPPGTSVGKHMHNGVEEFYYVMNGRGEITVHQESAPVKAGDAVPLQAREAHGLVNNGSEPLEVIIIGVAVHKGVLDATDVK
jgi:mannose-6-phosphate isomerase-like protein (cupin superfamily)